MGISMAMFIAVILAVCLFRFKQRQKNSSIAFKDLQ